MTKQELRQLIREKQKTLSSSYINQAGEAIEINVLNSDVFKKSESVFVYVSMANEPSTFRIIENALEKGKRVFVPKCIDKGVMVPVRIYSPEVLKPGAYGIMEPDEYDEGDEDIALAVIPCVSASRDGKRLGHGGGYYDRFLEDTHSFKLCLCFEKLLSENIPVSALDVRMNAVFTENDKLYFEV